MKTYGRYHIHKLVVEHDITYGIDSKDKIYQLSIDKVTEIGKGMERENKVLKSKNQNQKPSNQKGKRTTNDLS